MQTIESVHYAKLNIGKIKDGKKDEAKRILINWFAELNGKTSGLEGFLILDGLTNEKELTVITLWKTKNAMDQFYSQDSIPLQKHLKESAAVREGVPDRRDYSVTSIKIQ